MINVYSVMYNEEFMLPHFLKHYEKVADRIFIIDDHSTDKTSEIAKAHPKVTYILKDKDGWDEKETSNIFETLAYGHRPGWAVCVDADEFIYGLDALGRPRGVLKTTGYMMVGETGKLVDCRHVRMPSFDKPVVFDSNLDISFGDGRHSVNRPTEKAELELWHYKYPSREHYLQRALDTYPRIMDAKDMSYRIKRGLDWYDRALADLGGKDGNSR
jgi:hypothetical protein